MFPDSSILEYSDSLAFTGLYTERIFGFLTHDDNSANIPDEMANKLLPRQRERKCRQKNVGGVLRQSEVFFSLADHVVANHVVQPGIW